MLRSFLRELGFETLSELLVTVLGIKSLTLVVLQVSAASLVAGSEFLADYIYKPPSAVFIIVGLILADTLLGLLVAYNAGHKVDLRKMTRMVPIMLSHLAVMSVSYHISLAEPVAFAWLPSAVFGFFAMRNFLSAVQNMIRLGWMRGEVLEYLNRRLSAADEHHLPAADKPEPPVPVLALVLLAGLTLSACATRQRCYRKYGEPGHIMFVRDTVRLTQPQSEGDKRLEADAVTLLAPGDSLVATTQDGTATAILTRLPSASPSQAGPYKLRAKRQAQTFVQPRAVPCPPVQTIRPPPVVVKQVPWWVSPVIWALLTLLAVQTLRKRFGLPGW